MSGIGCRAPHRSMWADLQGVSFSQGYVRVGEDLAALIPGARLVVMQDCGHWPQLEDPDTLNRIHIEFLLGS